MKIYFTGATSFNVEQKDKDKSLGGYMSSTTVPNDIFSNLFGEVSMYGLDEKLRETRALIITNESKDDLTNLYIWFDKLNDALGKFEIAAVLPTVEESTGEVYMETIDNIRATPYTGNFVEADTVANKKLIANTMLSKSYIGLWIRRTLTAADKEQFNCDTMYAKYKEDNNSELTTEGGVGITLEWD